MTRTASSSSRAALRFQSTWQPCQVQRTVSDTPSFPFERFFVVSSSARRASTQAKPSDSINPPQTTLPPPLSLPTRDEYPSAPIYWFRVGRAYGSFYWAGVKATYTNYKSVNALLQKLKDDGVQYPAAPFYRPGIRWAYTLNLCDTLIARKHLNRGQFQMLTRNCNDVEKLPLFGILVALFGEWLPLIVPFIPGAVPYTCRIPKQIEGMRRAAEARRKESFRSGSDAPDQKMLESTNRELHDPTRVNAQIQQGEEGKLADYSFKAPSSPQDDKRAGTAFAVDAVTETLTQPQLLHISNSLGLHRQMWNRIGMPPPASLLKRGVNLRLHYLNMDDTLLLKQGRLSGLSLDEVGIACDERGIDVSGRSEKEIRQDLGRWLECRRGAGAAGGELLELLFKRPNAWAQSSPK